MAHQKFSGDPTVLHSRISILQCNVELAHADQLLQQISINHN